MDEYQDLINLNIILAVSQFGDEANLWERRRATDFLLSVPEKSFPILMKLISNKPDSFETAELINIIGLFKKDESVTLLGDLLLKGTPQISRSAGRALGIIGSSLANKALKKGLNAANPETKIATVEGMRVSNDRFWCKHIQSFLNDADSNLRYYAVNAAAELECINFHLLKMIGEQDLDENVRKLSLEWQQKYH